MAMSTTATGSSATAGVSHQNWAAAKASPIASLYPSLAAAYGGVGLIMLVIGGIVIDVLIPGKLRQQIWIERNLNGAIFLSSAIFALASHLGE